MQTERKIIGTDGEARVARYLTERGFTILARNYAKLYGEIDIIALQGDIIAFVEVKARMYHYINPEIITRTKQKKIIMTAQSFIAAHDYYDKTYRFDVAFVTVVNETINIEYIDNAFGE